MTQAQEPTTEVVENTEALSAEEQKQNEENIARAMVDDAAYKPVPVTIKSLMEAGSHFGHQVERWNPRMASYIFGEKNGIHIINLDMSVQLWERARKFIVDLSSRGGEILFVGTKNQARDAIKAAANRSGSYFVSYRWLGGTLSNFQTIKNSITRMEKLEQLLKQSEEPDSKVKLVKKEKTSIAKELVKLDNSLGGIRGMRKLPNLIFVVDIIKEAIAVREARRLRIPVIALVDTNTDPALVDFPIPSNDDSTRTIELFTNAVSDAVREGKSEHKARVSKEQSERKQGGHGSGGDKKRGRGGAKAAAATATTATETGATLI